ncbi:DUF1177 domain-containing protein [Halobacteria archaeon AArc-curdl1]|uniref:DUF1177 domain-containing protein n=2 Tax=Natronosalvus hydrolyticus TaxID=2979988 RepID=A0AAP2ZBS9_9EURY|nr:DUF1177 domain-containing protein [Halobacteria archaeon AArc-curdl1]
MFNHVQDTISMLDSPDAAGDTVSAAFEDTPAVVDVTTFEGPEGTTDFVTVRLPGTEDDAPTLGVVGRLGGVGARPGKVGMVSDADGAIVALSTAAKLAEMAERGERLPGDVILSTHICPDAPTIDHDPVPFMSSPVDIETMNAHEVSDEMDAVLTIDATKGNRVHCQRGFAITPTVKQGWILRPSEDLLDIQERVTGEPPSTLTLTMQDITPYGNDVHHINSILQPSTATDAPVVGVATTSVSPVAGSATGANYISDIDATSRFVLETAKDFTHGWASVYDEGEFAHLHELYGSMSHLQTLGGDR